MKTFKLRLLSFLIALLAITSCTNDEPVVQDQQVTEESQAITTSLNQLSLQLDESGNFTADSNPAGNVVFDFCFDFVYPLTLSYNNGSTVTVENLDELVDVILNFSNDLYVDGISFPFDVEVYNDDNDAIEILTINDELEFIELLDACDFDDFDDCVCTEEYDPVCVEIMDPTGVSFTITYPNACYAECDGFTEADFVEDCVDDYYAGGDLFCFDFVYPLDIVTDDAVITIASEEDFGNALYAVYDFDFVYPFDVITADETIVTINSEEDFENLLDACYDDYDDDEEECEECEDQPLDPVCIEYIDDSGNTIFTVLPNMCYVECLGFDESNIVDCENDGNPAECNADDILANISNCEWYAFTTLLPQELELVFIFNEDGTVVVETENTVVTGTWEISSTPAGGVFMFFSLPEPLTAISNADWAVIECTEGGLLLESNGQILALEQNCD